MTAKIEHEIKLLPNDKNNPLILEALKQAPQYIQQGYLQLGNPEVRVRSITDNGATTYFKATKTEISPGVREEDEKPISESSFNKDWEDTQGRCIYKRRYRINETQGDFVYVYEVDVYDDHLSGLITVEVEFVSDAAATNFQIPVGFIDITNDKRYKNQNLAVKGIPSR